MKKEIEEKVIEESKKRNQEGSDFHITSTISNFRDGELAIVCFLNQQKLQQEIFVYVDTENYEVYTRSEELIRTVSSKRDGFGFLQQFGIDKILDVGGIAGLIAILIGVTICYSFINNPSQVIPDILSNALTVILGFYFGSKTK